MGIIGIEGYVWYMLLRPARPRGQLTVSAYTLRFTTDGYVMMSVI